MSASEPQFGQRHARSLGRVDLSLVRDEPDETVDERVSGRLELTPQAHPLVMLGEPGASP